MFELFNKGGIVMWVLLGTSVWGFAIVIQKVWLIRATQIRESVLASFKATLATSGATAAISDLRSKHGYTAELIESVAELAEDKHKSMDALVNEQIEDTKSGFESQLNVLSAIISITPLLGLLGTILGLMSIFNVLSGGEIADSSQLSAGIAEALITTVAGLSIVMPLMLAQQLIYGKLEDRLKDVEAITKIVLEQLLHSTASKGPRSL